MLVTLFPIVTLVSFEQPSNAKTPMIITLLGIFTLVISISPLRTSSILVTMYPSIVGGIIKSLSIQVPIPVILQVLPSSLIEYFSSREKLIARDFSDILYWWDDED